ncbi:hypothetical protein D0440_26055 [Priestia megaterium]|nr:hypothetical protein D0440_26055 [Priestia megaterium]
MPREVAEAPSTEIVKTQLDTVLGDLLWVTPLEQGGLDQIISRGPFQPQPFCDSSQPQAAWPARRSWEALL